MENKDCLFCKIVRDEIPAEVIYRDNVCIAFLDIHPNNLGHTLIVPLEHYENLYDLPDEKLSRLAPQIKKVALMVKKGVSADGINITMNNERAAGQIVNHTHVHIIPRFNDDGFKHWPSKNPTAAELHEIKEKIIKVIN